MNLVLFIVGLFLTVSLGAAVTVVAAVRVGALADQRQCIPGEEVDLPDYDFEQRIFRVGSTQTTEAVLRLPLGAGGQGT
jgi:urease accessory protein UreE